MTFDITTSSIIKVFAVLLAFVFLYLLRDVIVILFFAIVIASAVHPLVNWLEVKRIPRLLAVLLLYLVLASLLAVFFSLVIPIIAFEMTQLGQALPRIFSGLSNAIEGAQSSGYFNFLSDLQIALESSSQFLQISSVSVLNFIIGLFGGIVSFLAILVISFYLSVMRQGVPDFLRSVLPDAYEKYVIGLWHRAESKVGRWFQGQLLLALVVGLVVFVGLSLFHIKYALLLGVIAMVFELVPVVGPVMSAIPAVILAFLQSPSPGLGISIIIFYTVVQQLESHVLAPLILGKTLGLHPVTVVIALLIGGKLAGILGILIAVPVAVVIVEVLDDMAAQRQSRKAVPV
ncbi:MAG: AI-2E family transporter [bacterium]|nr:AI-2E family transporter [bacterium]